MDLDQLRDEIQTDRIEIQRSIAQGFDKINTRFDVFAEKQSSMDKRLVVVEKTQSTIVSTVIGIVSVGFTTAIGWVVSIFSGKP